jgi:ABC-type multidrug transport system ATPase subunit/CBS domain-containing protein
MTPTVATFAPNGTRRRHITVDDRDITGVSARAALQAGVGHIPQDRTGRGLILDFTVAENLALRDYREPPNARLGALFPHAIERTARRLIAEYDVRGGDARSKTKELSGGNMQKVVVARELARDPKLLVASQPTRGLDIGATELVHQRLVAERDEGRAILLVSLELDEILALSDRILVLYEGRVAGEYPSTVTKNELGIAMTGGCSETRRRPRHLRQRHERRPARERPGAARRGAGLALPDGRSVGAPMPTEAPGRTISQSQEGRQPMKHEVLPVPRATLGGGTVADVMHPGVVTCSYATPLATVARMMTLHRIHAVVVYRDGDMDPGDTNRFWGVVSDLDVVSAAVAEGEFSGKSAGAAAHEPIVFVAADDPLERAAQLMTDHRISHLLVVGNELAIPVGVISSLDLAGVLAQ